MIETIDSREESTPRDGYFLWTKKNDFFPSFHISENVTEVCVVGAEVKVVNNHKKSFLYDSFLAEEIKI